MLIPIVQLCIIVFHIKNCIYNISVSMVFLIKSDNCRFATRLIGFKENTKFTTLGLKHVVDEAKQHYNVKYGLGF